MGAHLIYTVLIDPWLVIIAMEDKEIHPLNDEWAFWYAIRGKEAKDAEHYNGTPVITQKI